MTLSTAGGRHRAAGRASTPLSALGEQLTGHVPRGMAALASSGLVITMAATTASAAPSGGETLPRVDVSALTAEARVAMRTAAPVTIPSGVRWDLETASATAAPPPDPGDVRLAVQRSVQAASRAGQRAELPQTEDAQTAVAATGAVETSATPAPAPSASASAVVSYARQFVGVPYVWGGASPAGFDCSGFTSYVFAQFGVGLPRTSSGQSVAGTRVSAADARPGDLVWWPGHVGIYTGNGNHIAARQPGVALTEGPIQHHSPVYLRVLQG